MSEVFVSKRYDLPVVSVAQVKFHAKIGAKLLYVRGLRRYGMHRRCTGERHYGPAGNFRSIEQHQLINQPAMQRAAVHSRPSFQQEAENFAAAQLG